MKAWSSQNKSHFALIEGSAIPTKGARNRFRSETQFDPMHLFGHTFDHDYYFELPRKRERDAQSISVIRSSNWITALTC